MDIVETISNIMFGDISFEKNIVRIIYEYSLKEYPIILTKEGIIKKIPGSDDVKISDELKSIDGSTYKYLALSNHSPIVSVYNKKGVKILTSKQSNIFNVQIIGDIIYIPLSDYGKSFSIKIHNLRTGESEIRSYDDILDGGKIQIYKDRIILYNEDLAHIYNPDGSFTIKEIFEVVYGYPDDNGYFYFMTGGIVCKQHIDENKATIVYNYNYVPSPYTRWYVVGVARRRIFIQTVNPKSIVCYDMDKKKIIFHYEKDFDSFSLIPNSDGSEMLLSRNSSRDLIDHFDVDKGVVINSFKIEPKKGAYAFSYF